MHHSSPAYHVVEVDELLQLQEVISNAVGLLKQDVLGGL
jgi:hypothetical protein